MAGKFEIFKDKSGEFRFHLKAPNGEIIASSQGYKSKESAENGIKSVQTHAPGATVVDQAPASGLLFGQRSARPVSSVSCG